MESEIARLESLLEEHAQLYLRALKSRDESEKYEQLGWIYGVLARLLQYHLNDTDDWPAGGCVDGIEDFVDFYPDEPPPAGELNLQGLMSWFGTAASGIEPFNASIRPSNTDGSALGYKMKCGDADRGLGKIAYGRRVRRWPEKWIFEFESSR
jgi:hypothetical protein